jgi:predicted RNase H-like HicB family nuclease
MRTMLTEYIEAAMRKAKYELLNDDEGFYGRIPPCRGVWGNADTLEECRDDLRAALESWIIVGLRLGHRLPVIDGINLNERKAPRKRNVA